MKLPGFTFTPRKNVVFATVFVIIALGAAYSLWYVPQQQEQLDRQQFRYLQNIETDIQAKVGNSLYMLTNWMDDYRADSLKYRRARVDRYLHNFHPAGFSIRYFANKPKTNPYAAQKKTEEEARVAANKNKLLNKAGTTLLKNADKNSVNPAVPVYASDTLVFVSDQIVGIRLHHDHVVMEIDYTLDQFLGGLLEPGGIFDQYIVYREPTVLYQTFATGTTGLIADSLKNDQAAFSNRQIKELTLGGVSYKLFTQQLMLPGGNKLTIAGLLSASRYRQARNRIPRQLTILLLISVLLAILGLPWLKIYQMGSRDRLTASDGILCLASPMLLMAVFFYTFLQFNRPLRGGTDAFEFGAEKIASKIDQHFSKELSETYKALTEATAVIDQHPYIPGRNNRNYNPWLLKAFRILNAQVRLSEVLRLNGAGKEQYSWSSDAPQAPPGDYANRAYYQQLHDGNPQYMEGNSQKPYGIEPVYSRVTGKFTTVMCVPSAKGSYTAVSFDLQCLQDPVLTPGFSFAIIDDEGHVLYHSDPSRQLNENLFEECSDRSDIAAAVHNRIKQVVRADYSGRDFSFYTHPISGPRYTVVVMEDNIYRTTRLSSTFFGCLILLAAFFLLLFLQLLLMFRLTIKPLYYKKHYFDLSWMGPDDRFIRCYNRSLAANATLIVSILVARRWVDSFAEFTMILLSAASLSFLVQQFIYALRYGWARSYRATLKKRSMVAIFAGWLLADAFFMITMQWNGLFIYQLIMVIVLVIIALLPLRRLKLRRLKWFYDPVKTYVLMTFSRLIITSALPVVLFFITLFNYGLHLEARDRQDQLIRQLIENEVSDSPSLKAQHTYFDQIWITGAMVLDQTPKPGRPDAEEKLSAALLHEFSLLQSDDEPDAPGLSQTSADDSWGHSQINRYGDVSWYNLGQGSTLLTASYALRYTLPGRGTAADNLLTFIFWVGVILILSGFLLLFYHVVKRLFARNLTNDHGWNVIDDLLMDSDGLNNLLFLIGPPGSSKLTTVTERIWRGLIRDRKGRPLITWSADGFKPRYFVADMILIPNNADDKAALGAWTDLFTQATDPAIALVIVNHFEYDIKNQDSNRAKLDLLEAILQRNTAKLIVVSTVHPVTFLDSLNAQNESSGNEQSPAGTPEHDLERWHVLLGHFRIAVQSFTSGVATAMPADNWGRTLRYETRSGRFLQALYPPIRAKRQQLLREGMTPPSLQLKLGTTAHYFYNYIWQSLTREEKFLLYDLAEDGLVNCYDDTNLILLVNKGLIMQQYGILRLFNEGFREFILTAIGPSEVREIQDTIRDNGNWSKLKPPLLLLATAILIFLFTSQKDAYTDILKYIAVITGGIPLITQVFSVIRSGSKS